MNPMQCQVKSHNSSQIIVACMDKKCKNKKLCCWQCISESHNTHPKQCVQIDQINNFIQYENNQTNKINQAQKQIIYGLEKIRDLIDCFQNLIRVRIDCLLKQIFEKICGLQRSIYEKIHIAEQSTLQEYLQSTSNSQKGVEYWNNFLEGIQQYIEVDNCIISVKQTKEGQLTRTEEQFINILKQSEESLQIMINQIDPAQKKTEHPTQQDSDNYKQMKIGKLCFKENRKNIDINLIDECTIKKTKTSSHAMAFAHEGFDPNTQSYQFGFNILNAAINVWVGVGNDEGDNVPSYLVNNYQEIGHGQYMITHHNFTLHHTDSIYNNNKLGMQFQTGDMIQIKYDHLTKVLEFKIQSDQNAAVKLTITDMTKKLYPCAYLHGEDDQVQLVQY